jgi:hypothetical protein
MPDKMAIDNQNGNADHSNDNGRSTQHDGAAARASGSSSQSVPNAHLAVVQLGNAPPIYISGGTNTINLLSVQPRFI